MKKIFISEKNIFSEIKKTNLNGTSRIFFRIKFGVNCIEKKSKFSKRFLDFGIISNVDTRPYGHQTLNQKM